MNPRLKILLMIAVGLLVLYGGVVLTNQSREKQGSRIQSNQESVEKKDDSYSGNLDHASRQKGNYNTDALKKSLGGN